ncbi:MAG: type II secretion system minor pseudopilin GspK, partial [Pseudohongiella sp.]
QARFTSYLHGAETLAAEVLARDGMESPVDHLQEAWAAQLPPFPTDDGWLEVQLLDAQGLYNINNLTVKSAYHDDLSAPPAQRFSEMQKQFIRLLQSFADYPLSEAEAIEITEAVIDWLDEDDQTGGPGGAESLYYSAEPITMNAANQFASDVSELALVRHMNSALLTRMRPLLTALPTVTALNINTAAPDVLAVINAGQNLQPLPPETVSALAQHRAQSALSETAALAMVPALQGIGADIVMSESNSSGADEQGQSRPYGVASQYFVVYASATIGDRSRHMTALLKRDETGVRTVSRTYGL